MKKTALFCAICLLVALIPLSAMANSTVAVTVSDVERDIITVEGAAPVDTIVSVLILNPDKTVLDVANEDEGAIQYMGQVYSLGGKYSCDIKMETGEAPHKTEGVFSIFVTIDNKLVYSNTNFVFYSNETKTDYVTELKNSTESEFLEIEEESLSKIEKIFETFSLTDHELYKETTPADLAKVIVAQEERNALVKPTDADLFLSKVLVLNAFNEGNYALVEGDSIKYTEFWAKEGDDISPLYSDYFVNDLDDTGKDAVINATISADYDGKDFSAPFAVFKDELLLHLIINNAAIGSGHIAEYMLGEFEEDYKAKGFKTDALAAIKDPEKRTDKLDEILACGATNIETLKTKFNKIVTATISPSAGGSGGGGGGGSVNAPTSGGGSKPVTTPTPTEAPAPTEAPKPTEAPEVTPEAAYPFTDMSGAAWAEDAVKYLYEKGIINGRNEKTFAPGETVTRAELVKMIVEALSVSAEEDKTFSDVNDGDWFAPYVKKAAAAGIVNGDGGAFRPNGAVTREDAAVIIFRALGLENSGEISFTDAGDISDYAKDAISAMSAGGYINGMGDGTFAPKNTLTRAQAAQLIYNALTKGDAK